MKDLLVTRMPGLASMQTSACANISPRSESSPYFANNTANDVNTKVTIFLGNVAYIYVSILIIYFCIVPKTTITNQEIIYCDYNQKDDKNTTNLKVAYDELEKRIRVFQNNVEGKITAALRLSNG
uniref:Uncharacterized protein n=1 Tax=Glossina palpalis gambiensis TaxID=67801 RepID=A0A1B0BLJ7_9MUSC